MPNHRRCLLLALVAGFSYEACRSTKGPQTYVPPSTRGATSFAALDSKRVLEAAMHYPEKAVEQVKQVPMSLTASDGSGLRLTSLTGRAVVQGPLAFTELHLTFHNPEDRVREGRFTITLPPEAAISRFAMKLADGWQEAEVVERQLARQIYEDFLHRRQDPALLEKKAGNEFRARIFPIPASGDKEILISYSQKLTGPDAPYKLFLSGLPKMDSLEITAFIGEQTTQKRASSLGGVMVTHKVVKVNEKNYAPDRDFEVNTSTSLAGLRHEDLALMRITPKISDVKTPMESLLVLVDTSASRAPAFHRHVRRLGELLARLKQTHSADTPLNVACFDQVVGSVFKGSLGEFTDQDLNLILARRPLGASDLHRALSWIGKTRGYRRVLLVTDGIATAGETDVSALREALQQSRGQVHRLDVMLSGGIRDEPGMKQLVTGAFESDGVLLDGDGSTESWARRLSHKTVSGINIAVKGARWSWPKRLDGVQPGDHALVFVDLASGQAGKELTAQLSGPISQTQTVAMATVKKPLLERAWVEARIAHLQQQRDSGAIGPDLRDAVVKQIIELSTKHRVLSDYTAMLVLETENDYARYGIKRDSLSDIVVVGASGIEVIQRNKPPVLWRGPPPRIVRPIQKRPDLAPRPEPAPQPTAATDDQLEAPARSDEAKEKDKKSLSVAGPAAEAAPTFAPPRRRPPSPAPAKPRPAPSARPPRAEEPEMAGRAEGQVREVVEQPPQGPPVPQGPPALTGKLAEVVALIKAGKVEQALVQALRWRAEQPGNVMALLALGEALQAHGQPVLAARVYGSIIDLFPSRADMRRFAGERLEALRRAGLELAVDTYAQAAKQRPDHALGHRLLGMALARQGKLEDALTAIETGLTQTYRINRDGVMRILREDMGLVAAALLRKQKDRRGELEQRLKKHGAEIASRPSLRFVLTWQTDANDVDFHIYDGKGGHAYHGGRELSSGGVLYADITNGYGPECFTINNAPEAFPYWLQIHYYSRGPMGYGMGKLQVLQHDGQGNLKFEDRPFVVMNDQAYVDLGQVKGPL